MAQHDTIAKEIIKRYKEDCTTQSITPGYIFVQYGIDQLSSEYALNSLRSYVFKAKKHKMKNFHPISVDPIQSEQISSFCNGITLDKNRKNPFTFTDMTGMFKMTFSDNSFMYLAKWLNGAGRNQKFENLFAGEKETWIKFLKFIKTTKRFRLKPKNGIFRIEMVNIPGRGEELCYFPLKDLNETPIVHPVIDKVNKDMNFFFDNLHLYTRYKRPGTKKIMLIGEPGSGKTSFCIKIAQKMAATKSVVFATDIRALAAHMHKCSKFNVSTIGILEDAETTLSGGSNILNFLDGIDSPTNKKGTYIIMTTNFPERIEKRILQRPGRIDKIFKFDALEDSYALKCVEIYLSEYLETNEEKEILTNEKNKLELIKIVSGLTGAQIKALVDSSIGLATSTEVSISIEVIAEAKEEMFKDLKDAYKYANDTSIKGKKQKLGFSQNNAKVQPLLFPVKEEEMF